MKIILSLLVFFLLSVHTSAQQFRPKTSADIYKELQILNHIPKVLYLAAHPDDENTGLLSWLVNEKHIETAYLSLTRGDGGQNLIGSEQGAALGLIRTYELLEARKLDGAKQYFTRAIDFGFSKNTDDTFNQWPIDSLTADVVWVIRNFQPDIIICRFPPTAAAGHGQHAASAVIAEKAFYAAANPNAFPEQLSSVGIWKSKRLLWNTFRFGNLNTTNEAQFKVTMGQYDALLGMGYGELAGLSRSLHRSQGAGTPSVAGVLTEYFQAVAGDTIHTSIFDGVPLDWSDMGKIEINLALSKIIKDFNFLKPDFSLPALLALRKKFRDEKTAYIAKEKKDALDQIILHCSGFMAEMVTTQAEAIPGEELNFSLNSIARTTLPIQIKQISWNGDTENFQLKLENDSLYKLKRTLSIPENAILTEPYWLSSATQSSALYTVEDKNMIGLATQPSPLITQVMLDIAGENIIVDVPLSFKKLDPIKGDIVERLRIIPAVNVKFIQSIYFSNHDSPLQVGIALRANHKKSNGILYLKVGKKILAKSSEIKVLAERDTTVYITLSKEVLNNLSNQPLEAVFESKKNQYSHNQELIQYPHLPVLQYFDVAATKIIRDDINVKVSKVGYVMGAGDLIPDFLRLAGIDVTILNESDFKNPQKLHDYEAIITGVRVLNAEKRMKEWMPLLNQYVENGGTLIMQFNTLQDLATQVYGPYPFTIGRDRVTEENSKVTFLNPQDRILNFPNKIRKEDFNNWVQERGLYFPSSWDKKYNPIFEMKDTSEKSLQGGTLYTDYGKGHYFYTPLAFFRQLPAGNIGAIKLFFNMLSIEK